MLIPYGGRVDPFHFELRFRRDDKEHRKIADPDFVEMFQTRMNLRFLDTDQCDIDMGLESL